MSEYSAGDTLEIIPRLVGSQTSRIRGVLLDHRLRSWTIAPEGTSTPLDFSIDDWVLVAVEQAPPKVELPTDVGWYMGRVGKPNYSILQLCADDDCPTPEDRPHWFLPVERRSLSAGEVAESYLPLARFEVRAVTAKAVLDRFEEVFSTSNKPLVTDIDTVRAEFGVTS